MKRTLTLFSALVFALSVFTGCGQLPQEEVPVSTSIPIVAPEDLPEQLPVDTKVPETAPPAETASPVTPETAPPESSEPVSEHPVNVEESFFDDAVFIGDSVSLKLNYYVTEIRESGGSCLGEAKFFTEGGLGWGNQLRDIGTQDALHGKLNGVATYTEDAVAQLGAKKVYIMLGMNDIAVFGVEGTVENAATICRKILDKSPDVEIFIQSPTPMMASAEARKLNNTSLRELGEGLKELCRENGYYYLDIASAVMDGNGCLKREYCSDPNSMGIHFTDAGCEAWIARLLEQPYGIDLS